MEDLPNKQLLIHYLLGISTPREARQIEAWLRRDASHVQLLQRLMNNRDQDVPLTAADKKDIKEKISAKIDLDGKNDQQSVDTVKKLNLPDKSDSYTSTFYTSSRLMLRVAAVILFILMAGAGGYYYYKEFNAKPKTVWKQRHLPYGQTATLRFSDGSSIKLNGGSTLRYPQKFEQNKREVYLTGEAYFSVTKNGSRPFIVHAGNITTRDLGTEFDVKAYKNENDVRIVVAEGKVAVSKDSILERQGANQPRQVILEKNQWVTYHNDSRVLETGEGDIWNMIAWKDQVLVFDNKTLGEVARMLERWYGVKIHFINPALKHIVLAGEHDDVSLQEVLNSIRFATGINYTMHGDIVTIRATPKMNIMDLN